MMKRSLTFTAILTTSFLSACLPAHADTVTLTPVADAFVGTGTQANDLSGDNFGMAGSLTVESGSLALGEYQSVIEFSLAAAETHFNNEYGPGAWNIQSVALVLTSSAHPNPMFNPPSAGQFGISLMQNNSWVEGTGTGGAPTTDGITYNSLTGTYINNSDDQALGNFSFGGGSSGTASYQLGLASDLMNDLNSGGNASLRLYPEDSSVSYLFNSRNGASPFPELVIVATPEPSPSMLAGIGAAVFSAYRFFCARRKR